MRQTRKAECFKCREDIEELGIIAKRKTKSEYTFVILHPDCAGFAVKPTNSLLTDFFDIKELRINNE